MNTVIVPVIKNKSGDVSDTNNYRPIALSSIVSKVFEIILLSRCEEYIESFDCQFYFKSGYSTDICIYTLKEIIHFYKSHSSPVFVCYMDATKAFDKINHWTLFNKLIDRGVPLIIVRMLYYWYHPSRYTDTPPPPPGQNPPGHNPSRTPPPPRTKTTSSLYFM